jgi:AcrR family transcriptional regulator
MITATGTRARRIADTKKRVADAALDLFVAHGFVATTVEQICAASAISRASFFRYFDNKEAVLSAEMDPTQEWLLEQIRDRPAGEPPIASIVAVCTAGDWPELDRTRLRKIRRVVRAEPALEDAQRVRAMNAFSPRLEACLHERDPNRSVVEIRLATDLAMSWIQWAITSHLRDSRPLSEHFDEVFTTTQDLARQLDDARRAT